MGTANVRVSPRRVEVISTVIGFCEADVLPGETGILVVKMEGCVDDCEGPDSDSGTPGYSVKVPV